MKELLTALASLVTVVVVTASVAGGCSQPPKKVNMPATSESKPAARKATAIEIVEAAKTGIVPSWFSQSEKDTVYQLRR